MQGESSMLVVTEATAVGSLTEEVQNKERAKVGTLEVTVFSNGERSGKRLRRKTQKDKIVSRGLFPATVKAAKRSR